MRLLSIALGLFLVVLYLTAGDVLGILESLTILVFAALPISRFIAAASFARSTFQMAILILPALMLLVWGIAPYLRTTTIDRVVGFFARHSMVVAVVLAVSATLVVFIFSTFVVEYHPITFGDEYCYSFQAKLLQSGRFYAPAPPVAGAFRNRAFIMGDRWYGIGFGGHPLFLVLGLWLGAAYWTPAILAGLSVLMTYLLIRALAGPGTAALAATMVGFSPLFLLYHSTLLAETSSLALGLGFLLLVVLGSQKNTLWLFVLAAIVLAFALVTRPQSAMMIGACVGVFLLARPGLSVRTRMGGLSILGIGVLAGVLGLLGYAHLVSGEPFGAHLSPGYHRDELGGIQGLGIRSSGDLITAVANLGVYLAKLNFVLLGWPLSWIAVALWLFHRGKSAWEYVLGATAVAHIVFYFFYRARHEQYYMEAGYYLIILGAIGVARAYRFAKCDPRAGSWLGFLSALVLCSYALGLLSIWPERLSYFRERASHERIVWEAVAGASVHRAIVFLDGLPEKYAACVGRNSPDLDDDVILAAVRNSSEIAAIARRFPGRAPFRLVPGASDGELRLLPYGDSASGMSSGMSPPSTTSDKKARGGW